MQTIIFHVHEGIVVYVNVRFLHCLSNPSHTSQQINNTRIVHQGFPLRFYSEKNFHKI